jgi:hypothetical protein
MTHRPWADCLWIAFAGALLGCGGGGGVVGGGGPAPQPVAVANVRALHDPASAQYDAECVKCHGDVLEEASLDARVPGAHPVMLPQVGGESDAVCVKCHESVDFDRGGSAANVRRNVDVQLCSACHTRGGGGYPFYVR